MDRWIGTRSGDFTLHCDIALSYTCCCWVRGWRKGQAELSKACRRTSHAHAGKRWRVRKGKSKLVTRDDILVKFELINSQSKPRYYRTKTKARRGSQNSIWESFPALPPFIFSIPGTPCTPCHLEGMTLKDANGTLSEEGWDTKQVAIRWTGHKNWRWVSSEVLPWSLELVPNYLHVPELWARLHLDTTARGVYQSNRREEGQAGEDNTFRPSSHCRKLTLLQTPYRLPKGTVVY